ncbi:MAG: hypothetical protein GEU78_14465 [Actinobacteria bacterium]|nr:hypothetical protein [Actinomycetota bacterium]
MTSRRGDTARRPDRRVEVDRPVRLDQLAEEVGALLNEKPPPMSSRSLDDGTVFEMWVPDSIDPSVVAIALAEHVPVWPQPPPDPVDKLEKAVAGARTIKGLRAALVDHLPAVLRQIRGDTP